MKIVELFQENVASFADAKRAKAEKDTLARIRTHDSSKGPYVLKKDDVVPKDAKPISMMQAFGSAEMNALDEVGIRLTEKPSYWDDFDGNGFAAKRNIHEITLKRAEKAVGRKFKVYKGTEVFGLIDKPRGPQVKTVMSPSDMEPMAIIEFGDGTRYLVDTTQANTYIRMWQKIV